MPAPLRIVIAGFPDLELLDVAGPASVFANAARLAPERAPYQVLLAATRRGAVPSSSGVALEAALELADAPRAIHTLLVPGGEGTRAALADAAYVAQVRRLARRASRVASVCSGSFVLAEAGLLDGRRATTHWRYAGLLRDA
jgi:transcriptional regulator GlxA family with amidase domain